MIRPLRDREAFVRVRRHGVRSRAETLWCSFLPDPLIAPPCVGFAIPRSTGTAVRRNRLRRRLRALLRARNLAPGAYVFGAITPTTAAGRSSRGTTSTNNRSSWKNPTEQSYVDLGREVDRLLDALQSSAT
ncbi:MAG: ribonuclease P protein component [Actinomycetota bacterium]